MSQLKSVRKEYSKERVVIIINGFAFTSPSLVNGRGYAVLDEVGSLLWIKVEKRPSLVLLFQWL